MIQGHSKQKVSETPPPISTNKLDMVVCTCDPSSMGGIVRRMVIGGGMSKKQDPV
jgi:hypothetical protein